MNDLDDALILEDYDRMISAIKSLIPEKFKYTMVESSNQFRNYLKQGKKAKLYFLDDIVPWIDGEEKRCFIAHANMLKHEDEKAKIFYMGSSPNEISEQYCKEKGIEIISKSDIYKKLVELI